MNLVKETTMKQLRLLDVTLRDGGHCCQFRFSPKILESILNGLNKATIDIVEIGYRNGYLGAKEQLGDAGQCYLDYLKYCRKQLSNTMMSVMVHPSLVSEFDFLELKQSGVDLIRICVSYQQHKKAERIIESCHKFGLMVSVNITHASQYKLLDLFEVVASVSSMGLDMIYFADSNGSFLPENVKQIYQHMSNLYNLPVGFHGHNNIGLAQTNTLQAIDAGAQYIDASLNGLGKGGGNLVLENFIAYLYACKNKRYYLPALIKPSEEVYEQIKIKQNQTGMDEYVRGIMDLSTKQLATKKQESPIIL